jgi:hypothetical protein
MADTPHKSKRRLEMSELALLGGKPVRTATWSQWSVFDQDDEDRLLDVFRTGKWWRHAYAQAVELVEDEIHPKSQVVQFQRAFA